MKRICAILLMLFSCANNVGTNDEVVTGARTGAVIYEPGGKTPAEGATVKVFNKDAEDGQYVSVQTTDNTGKFSLKGLAKGSYNIWAEKDTFVTFQTSAVITPTDTVVHDDTLACPSTISGIVGVQPQDDPRTVTIQVLGLDKYFNNIDKFGRFTMKNMAKGNYTLLLKSTQQNYTPTTAQITVDTSVNASLMKDTLWLTYTGIPVVTGLTARYDTAQGAVRLSWNATDYRDLQAYIIYRDFYDSVTFSTNPYAAQSDTVFVDRIFGAQSASDRFSFSDTNDYHFRYRVAIRNNVNAIGQTFRYADIVAASPAKVRTAFSLSSRHVAKGYITRASFDTSASVKGEFMTVGSASINDSMVIVASVSNPTRGLKKLIWRDGSGNALKAVALDSTKQTAVDSITRGWPTLGTKLVICSVVDDAGAEWSDTVSVKIVADLPKIKLLIGDTAFTKSDTAPGNPHYAVGDTIPLRVGASDSFGVIVKVDWAFGYGTAVKSNAITFDTFAAAPSAPQTHYPIFAHVTDDDGNTVSDSLFVSVNVFSPVAYGAAFRPRIRHISAAFDDKLWIFGGTGLQDSLPTSETWYSENGTTWTPVNSNLPARLNQSIIGFKNKLWMIGGTVNITEKEGKNDVWSSPDGVFWTCVASSAAFSPRYGHSGVVFNGKMWIMGGMGNASAALNDVWSSEDGVVWTKAADSAAFPRRFGQESVVFNGKMWIIGGQDSAYDFFNDIWCSADGVEWVEATPRAAFPSAIGRRCLVFNEKIWAIGGRELENPSTDDNIWNSSDGTTWTHAVEGTDFAPRAFHSAAAFHNRIWVIAGKSNSNGQNYLNDVWHSGSFVK